MMAALGVRQISAPIEAPDLANGPVYTGWREARAMPVYVVSLNERREPVARPLTHYPRHSPDGFGWGLTIGETNGGPADLAYAILHDYLAQGAGQLMSRARWFQAIDETAEALHQEFKGAFVVYFSPGHWHLSAASVRDWLRLMREDPETPCELRLALGYLLHKR